MKKSIFFLLLIASIFVACEPQQTEEPSFVNEDVYGVWVCENKGFKYLGEEEDLLYVINKKNTKFISEDSLLIYHGNWKYSEKSDLGYLKYKYEVMKGEKLILTAHNGFTDEYITHECVWRPDLAVEAENFIKNKTSKNEIKGFLGKWEWVATENLNEKDIEFYKHVIDTLENSIIEFKTNTFIVLRGGAFSANDKKYFLYTMLPYSATITQKNAAIIADKVLPLLYNIHISKPITYIYFAFPVYRDNEYAGYMDYMGGSPYKFLFENNNLILEDLDSDTRITFRKVE